MTRIAPVRLTLNPKVFWFDAKDFELDVDTPVVVSTVRGNEFGHVAEPIFEATEEQLATLKSELKPVVRPATEQDEAGAEEAVQLSLAAMPVFRELAEEEGLDMRPIAVEYLFTCDKAIFYFEAEQRIDFRELVRKLANRLHVRVDMRQIGSRDEARMLGGLGHCGQELCCKRLGGEFSPVTIRMAKEQGLSLNPQKISGLCGKLMCCLRYEYEAYKDFHGRAPKINEMISTPAGDAKVIDQDVPREVLTLLTPDDKKVKIALADMVADAPDAKPNRVDEEVWERTLSATGVGGIYEATYQTSKFTSESALGSAKAVHTHEGASRPTSSSKTAKGSASTKSKGGEGSANNKGGKAQSQSRTASGAKATQKASGASSSSPTRRHRGEARHLDTGTMSTSSASSAKQTASSSHTTSQLSREQLTGGSAHTPSAQGNRPGQHSSNIRGNANTGSSTQNKSGNSSKQGAQATSSQKQTSAKQQNRSQNQNKSNNRDNASGKTSANASSKTASSSTGRRQPRRRTRIEGDSTNSTASGGNKDA